MADTYTATVEGARAAGEGLVLVEREGAHAVVTLNDPAKLNPLGAALTVRLREVLTELAADESLRAIVLTGADPAFSAGGDLRLMRDTAQSMLQNSGAPELWRWIRMEFGGIARLITRTDKAFVAAVNGSAAGVGLAFALACDLILVSERARLVPAFGRVGLLPEVGTSWLLTRRLGYQRAFELFAGGRHLSGAEAAELGLANAVVAHDELLVAARERCRQIDELPRHVTAMMKPLLRSAADMTWEQAIAMEEFAEPQCFTTEAHRAAVSELLAGR
ncbi:MAG: enoyl-CoA hydratase/isomerase family protein [Pseudonocardiaceae bacterium]